MDALELAKQAKKQNIIDMAVGFSGMMPLFEEGSPDLIKEKLTELCEGLDRVSLEQDFSKMHREFCQWFVKTIRLAKSEQPSSYGHAAKLLDLALKVYVHYCKMPRPAKAEALIPMLNGAIDTHMEYTMSARTWAGLTWVRTTTPPVSRLPVSDAGGLGWAWRSIQKPQSCSSVPTVEEAMAIGFDCGSSNCRDLPERPV